MAAEFGADGPTRTCYHYGFAGNVRTHEFGARGDGVAAEQIDDRDFFQRADFDFTVHQVFHAGDGQHFAFVFFEALNDAAAFFLSGAGDGEQDFFHTVAVDERLDVFRTIDGQVVDDGAADFGVVVHKGDGGIFVDLFDGFQQLAAGLSCAVNDDGHHLFFVAVGQDGAQNHARTGDTDDQQQEINDGQGEVQFTFENQSGQAEQDCRNQAAECGGGQDAGADEAGNGAVQPQSDK